MVVICNCTSKIDILKHKMHQDQHLLTFHHEDELKYQLRKRLTASTEFSKLMIREDCHRKYCHKDIKYLICHLRASDSHIRLTGTLTSKIHLH